jgi:DNA modification methylase
MNTLPKPFYQSDRVTIYNADCLAVLPLLKGCDAVVSDPPYGINFLHGSGGHGKTNIVSKKRIFGDDKPFDPAPILSFCGYGRTKKQIPIALFGCNNYSSKLPDAEFLTWDKTCNVTGANTFTDAEYIWTNRKNARKIFRHIWSGCIREGEDSPSNTSRKHPSQKPVELMMWLLDVCRIGVNHTVLDPYMGSGSTGVACLRTGRSFVGIEIDPEYCQIAVERLQKEEAVL